MTPERAEQTAAILAAGNADLGSVTETLRQLGRELHAAVGGLPLNTALLQTVRAIAAHRLSPPSGYHWEAEQEGENIDLYLAADEPAVSPRFDPAVAAELIRTALFAVEHEVITRPYVTSSSFRPGPDGRLPEETPAERQKRLFTAGFMNLAEQGLIDLPSMAVLMERMQRGISLIRQQE